MLRQLTNSKPELQGRGLLLALTYFFSARAYVPRRRNFAAQSARTDTRMDAELPCTHDSCGAPKPAPALNKKHVLLVGLAGIPVSRNANSTSPLEFDARGVAAERSEQLRAPPRGACACPPGNQFPGLSRWQPAETRRLTSRTVDTAVVMFAAFQDPRVSKSPAGTGETLSSAFYLQAARKPTETFLPKDRPVPPSPVISVTPSVPPQGDLVEIEVTSTAS